MYFVITSAILTKCCHLKAQCFCLAYEIVYICNNVKVFLCCVFGFVLFFVLFLFFCFCFLLCLRTLKSTSLFLLYTGLTINDNKSSFPSRARWYTVRLQWAAVSPVHSTGETLRSRTSTLLHRRNGIKVAHH